MVTLSKIRYIYVFEVVMMYGAQLKSLLQSWRETCYVTSVIVIYKNSNTVNNHY